MATFDEIQAKRRGTDYIPNIPLIPIPQKVDRKAFYHKNFDESLLKPLKEVVFVVTNLAPDVMAKDLYVLFEMYVDVLVVSFTPTGSMGLVLGLFDPDRLKLLVDAVNGIGMGASGTPVNIIPSFYDFYRSHFSTAACPKGGQCPYLHDPYRRQICRWAYMPGRACGSKNCPHNHSEDRRPELCPHFLEKPPASAHAQRKRLSAGTPTAYVHCFIAPPDVCMSEEAVLREFCKDHLELNVVGYNLIDDQMKIRFQDATTALRFITLVNGEIFVGPDGRSFIFREARFYFGPLQVGEAQEDAWFPRIKKRRLEESSNYKLLKVTGVAPEINAFGLFVITSYFADVVMISTSRDHQSAYVAVNGSVAVQALMEELNGVALRGSVLQMEVSALSNPHLHTEEPYPERRVADAIPWISHPCNGYTAQCSSRHEVQDSRDARYPYAPLCEFFIRSGISTTGYTHKLKLCERLAIQTPPAVKEEDVKEHLQLFGTMVHFEISNTPKAKALVAGFATLSEAADAYLGTLNHPFKPEGGGKSLFVDTLMFVPNTKGGNTKADGS